MVAAIQANPAMPKNVSVTVIEHADGTVSVGISAAGRGVNQQSKSEPKATFPQEIVTSLNGGGNGPYKTGPAPAIAGLERGNNGAPMPNNCSEPHAASVAAESASERVGYQTAWAGSESKNPYKVGDPPARTSDSATSPTLMNPCGTCEKPENASKYDSTMQGAPADSGTTNAPGSGDGGG